MDSTGDRSESSDGALGSSSDDDASSRPVESEMFADEQEDAGGEELSHRGPGNRAVIKCSDFGTGFTVSSESDRGTRRPRKELKNRSMAKGKLT
jgi:hypothetical protein